MRNLILKLILTSTLLFSKDFTIKGKLLGSEGDPMKLAYVKIYGKMGEKPLKLVKVDKDGSFDFKVKDDQIHWIEFSGVDHFPLQDYFIPSLYGNEIEFEVYLKQFFPQKHLEEVYLVVKNGGEENYETVTLEKNSNGIYKGEYENKYDTLRYELFGHLSEQRATNGSMADAYEYDGFGDYNSLIIDKKGKIELKFDPNQYKLNWDRPTLEITTKTNDLQTQLDKANDLLNRKYSINTDEVSYEELNTLTIENLNGLEKIYNNVNDKLVKKMISTYYLYEAIEKQSLTLHPAANKNLYKEMVDKIEYNSALWNMQNLRYIAAISLKVAGYDILNSDKLDKIYEIYKGGELSEYILINKLDFASSTQNAKALKDLYNEYFEYYSESTYAPRIKQQYDPKIRIRVGNKAPNFTIKDINGNSINLSDYKGRYLMIDFWATWCGPCMKEMPQLHKAYEKFSGDNFEVLSLSFDKSPEAIDRMRDGSRFKMPWEHAFVNNGFKSDLAKTYEVSGIPKPILIDPNGIIVAVGGDLRGANLELTLSRFIDN